MNRNLVFMLTLLTKDYWITDSPEMLVAKIRLESHLVKFRAFHSYDLNYRDLTRIWLGEVKVNEHAFTLFRVTGKDKTSDIRIAGKYSTLHNRPMVRVKFSVHYSALLGLFGLLVTTYTLFHLLGKRGIIVHELISILGMLLVGGLYCYSMFRDLNRSQQLLEKMLSKKYESLL